MAEHYRPDGLYQGYYCSTCGRAGVNLYGMHLGEQHGPGYCEPNPELVALITSLNTPEAIARREFLADLRYSNAPSDD